MVRRVCVFIGSRANYSSIRAAMVAIRENPMLELQIVVSASAVLDKYGAVVNLIEADGFEITRKSYMSIQGETPATMAKSTGLCMMDMSTIFDEIEPDFVIVVGDRYEIMAPALAAAYMNIPLVHTMGGEVTGTIDESIRHAVTKLAHIHFPANKESADRIVKLGERKDMVFTVGCPRIDMVKKIMEEPFEDLEHICSLYGGVGYEIDFNSPFLLVSQHPVTTEFSSAQQQMMETINAIDALDMQTIMLWPNSDAGSDNISRAIRKYREKKPNNKIHLFKNLPMNVYITLMMKTACLIGNSSSGIREGEFMGTPCVNIGTRQEGRERGKNVIDVDNKSEQIIEAVKKQIMHGRYGSEHIYGDGRAGERIAEILASIDRVSVQKRITY